MKKISILFLTLAMVFSAFSLPALAEDSLSLGLSVVT